MYKLKILSVATIYENIWFSLEKLVEKNKSKYNQMTFKEVGIKQKISASFCLRHMKENNKSKMPWNVL